MTPHPRLGPLRWLAHKVLGWEYVVLTIDEGRPWGRSRQRRAIVRAFHDGDDTHPVTQWHGWWHPLHRDGSAGGTYPATEQHTTPRVHDSRDFYLGTWHPLTPGVAGFYRGTGDETT